MYWTGLETKSGDQSGTLLTEDASPRSVGYPRTSDYCPRSMGYRTSDLGLLPSALGPRSWTLGPRPLASGLLVLIYSVDRELIVDGSIRLDSSMTRLVLIDPPTYSSIYPWLIVWIVIRRVRDGVEDESHY